MKHITANEIVEEILSIIDRNGFTTDEIENVETVREELLDFVYYMRQSEQQYEGEDIISYGPF
jgi:hypothetical protein